MRPDHVQAFIDSVLTYAQRGQDGTGIPVSVILAQWGCESGWGRLPAARDGHNLAHIMAAGRPKRYPSLDAFTDDWIRVIRLPWYDAVRGACEGDANPEAVARALGESPWDAGHYADRGVPGAYLVRIMRDFALEEYDL